MREALAAARHDGLLSEPANPARRSRRAAPQASRRYGLSAPKMRRILRYAVGALCLAALAGIAINALTLQKRRHPAPLFVHAAAPAVEKAPAAAPPPPAPRPEQIAPVDAAPAAKPVPEEKAAALSHPTPVPPRDAISELLAGRTPGAEAAPSARTVLAVQKALVRLGFVLKPDGVLGATTRQAIERYERDRHRASGGELTPALLRRLSAESGEPIN